VLRPPTIGGIVLQELRSHLSYSNVAATIALVLATTGFAVAAIPDSSGSITGCYAKKKGNLRVIDASKKCRKGERKIAWNQEGPPGAAGPKGDPGAPGAPGATSVIARSDTVVGTTSGTARSATVTCPAGQHATGGGVSVANMPQADFKVIGSNPLDVDVPATGWRGTIYPTASDADALIFAYAVCAAP
jgi:hypothetical protein